MDIHKLINRIRIAIDAYINGIRRQKISYAENKRILIIFQQIFGDAVVFSKALRAYAKLYPQNQGYEITFIARPSVIRFMKSVVPMDISIKIRQVDFKRLVEDYSYYKAIIAEYRNYADTIIVPGTSLSAEILSCACNAKRKIGLVRSIPITKPFIMAKFYRAAYTETVIPNKSDMMLQRHRLLLNYLGLTEFQATLPDLLPKKAIVKNLHYAVLCPGSSMPEKCWPVERFIEVVDYLSAKFQMCVYLCGGTEEIGFGEVICQGVRDKDKVFNCIGKTTFSDWSALVQYADIVIGNDSATIHLAAAARIPSVCIVGVYDKYQFFPYKVDALGEEDKLPEIVCKEQTCQWCRTIGYYAGYGNSKCHKRIRKGQCAICIDEITLEDVLKEVDKIMGNTDLKTM